MSAAIPRPSRATPERSWTAAMRLNGCGPWVNSAGRPTSSSRPASSDDSAIMQDSEARVHRQAKEAQRGENPAGEPVKHDVHCALDQAVQDAKADITPREPIIDPAAEIHQRERDGDRVEDRRLLEQMIVIVRLPLRGRFGAPFEVVAAKASAHVR